MTYTAPPTFAANAILASADLQVLSDDISDLDVRAQGAAFSGCQLTRTGTLTLADSTWTAITWTSTSFDVGGWYSSGTSAVVPAGAIPAGYSGAMVQVVARLRYAVNATGKRGIQILKNGSDAGTFTQPGISGDDTVVQIVWYVTAVAADTIEIGAYQDSGGTLGVTAAVSIVRFAPLV